MDKEEEPPAKDAIAATESGTNFLHPDTASASGSQRLRLMPPDGKPLPWHIRHRQKIMLVETVLTALFLLLALYFLWLWIFSPVSVAWADGASGLAAALLPSPFARTEKTPRPDKPKAWRYAIIAYTLAPFAILGVFLFLFAYTDAEAETDSQPVPEFEPFAADREGFVDALTALQPILPDPSWRVDAKPGRWRLIVVHHTATKGGSAKSIDRHHREVNKWENGLAYHFLIGNGRDMPDGEVFASRRWLEQLDGAHIKEMREHKKPNAFAIGIALVGNFEEAVATPRQLAALRGLLGFLMREYGLKATDIVGHGEAAVKYTACPGKLFFLDEVRNTLYTGSR